MLMKDRQRGGTCYLVPQLSKIVRELVWAGVRIGYGIDHGFGGNGALYRLGLASQCIGPDSQLWPAQEVIDSLPSLENLEIGLPSEAIPHTPYLVSRASSS
jgi:hypothetical protein